MIYRVLFGVRGTESAAAALCDIRNELLFGMYSAILLTIVISTPRRIGLVADSRYRFSPRPFSSTVVQFDFPSVGFFFFFEDWPVAAQSGEKERSREHTGNLIQSGGKTEIGLAPYAASFTLYYTNRVGLRAGSDSGRVVYRPLPASIAVKRVEDPPLRHRPQGPSTSSPFSTRLDARGTKRERERERDDSLFEERSSAYRTGSSNISNYRRSVDLHARRERIRKFASRGEVKHGQSPRDPKRERERGSRNAAEGPSFCCRV